MFRSGAEKGQPSARLVAVLVPGRGAVRATRDMLTQPGLANGEPFWLTAHRTFAAIADPILAAHCSDYLRVVQANMMIATGHHKRISATRLPLMPLTVWALAACLPLVWVRPRRAFVVAWLLAVHVGSLLLICATHVPVPRLVQLTEFLVIVAVVLAWTEWLRSARQRRARCCRSASPAVRAQSMLE